MSEQNDRRLSDDPESVDAIYQKMMALVDGIADKSVSVDECEAAAKAGHVAAKAVEIDLHARIFAAREETSLRRLKRLSRQVAAPPPEEAAQAAE